MTGHTAPASSPRAPTAPAPQDLARELHRRLVLDGVTLGAAGQPHGLSATDVAALLDAEGLPSRREIQAERRRDLARRLWDGITVHAMTLGEAAQAQGLERPRAWAVLRREGYDLRGVRRQRREERTAAMWQRHHAGGLTVEDTAREFGLASSYVAVLFRQAGLAIREDAGRAEQRRARTQAMWARYDGDQVSLETVGAEFGVSKERVRQIFVAAGLPTRARSGTRRVAPPGPSAYRD